jgi:histidine ammonia-lyase
MAASQAFDLLRPLKSTPKLERLHAFVRQHVPYLEKDYVFTEYIEAIAAFIKSGEILALIEN